MSDDVSNANPQPLQFHPELTPPKDEVFTYLLECAAEGKLPVYFGYVPLELLQPFSACMNPGSSPIRRKVVDAVKASWESGADLSYIWIYPRDQHFVMSDDYILYYAAVERHDDTYPCVILGEPARGTVRNLQGPLPLEQVRTALGL